MNPVATLRVAWPRALCVTSRGRASATRHQEQVEPFVDVGRQPELDRAQIRAQVANAKVDLVNVLAAKEAVLAVRVALVDARQRLLLAEWRYEQGVGSIIELGDAQLGHDRVAAKKAQADAALSSARAPLVLALGRRQG